MGVVRRVESSGTGPVGLLMAMEVRGEAAGVSGAPGPIPWIVGRVGEVIVVSGSRGT